MRDDTRCRLVISGIVQGVGFRPAVYRLATHLGLAGFVGNDADGVFVEVQGPTASVDEFLAALRSSAPPLATVDAVAVSSIALRPDSPDGFAIVESGPASEWGAALVAPDVGPCADCLAELADPHDRRHRYPFINCTNCGPRYSIIRSVPYDRPATTMASFDLCDLCAAEYHDPTDRRYHAQPICCPACGPRLMLRRVEGSADDPPVAEGDVVGRVAALLRHGSIVAVKGVGGYHLAVDAANEVAVARVRSRKHREEKPFALLVADVAAARALCEVSEVEADLLTSPERPIVLLRQRPGASVAVAPSVAPGNRTLGLMLPPSPLHVLLAGDFGGPLVLTSGNRSNEPIVHVDAEALSQLGDIADVICTHDRPIHIRVDDSVTRVVANREIVVRRARGHAPRPIAFARGFPRHTLACGAELKSTVCVGRDQRGIVSQHLGDLSNAETRLAFEHTVDHLCALLGARPQVAAHDLHPDMASTSFALELGIDTVAVQHHHAHIASCLADNGAAGPVIGVAFDGLGLGTDGSIWGGEILRADLADFTRLGHLRPVPMPGGDTAIRQPWRMAAMHLATVLDIGPIPSLDVFARNRDGWPAVQSMGRTGVQSPLTSSAGRLFDAVAALVGIRDEVAYEGQAAIELEQRADLAEGGSYPVGFADGAPFVVDTAPVIAAIADDLTGGVAVERIAGRFHNAVVDLIVGSCHRGRTLTGITTVALSGGVFQNALLVERTTAALGRAGFEVLTHRRVPPNDGGISLGQAVIAATRDRAG